MATAKSSDIVTLLNACSKQKDLERGVAVHADILIRDLLRSNHYIANALVNMYAKRGALPKAEDVLSELPVRDVVSWNTLISGYMQCGQFKDALNCYERMEDDGVFFTPGTLVCTLKACSRLGAGHSGHRIHEKIARQGFLGKESVLGTALVDMYAKCGALKKAAMVLDELPVRDIVSWTALIAGYVHQGQGEEALKCFEWMQWEGISPNTVTFISVLKACSLIGAIEKGEGIHQEIARQEILGKDVALGNTLVCMYAKCGALAKASQVLRELPIRNVVSWNALIAGYVKQGQFVDALHCYDQMQLGGCSPNAVTFICIVKACGSMIAAEKGEMIHEEIVRCGILGKDARLGNALVDMYAKFGNLAKAAQVLDDLPVRDAVSWSSLIAGYLQQGLGQKALTSFEHMLGEGLSPDKVTFVCILKACGSTGEADKGERIHDEIVRRDLLCSDTVLGNSLVDMYARCGDLAKASELFLKLPVRDVVGWSTLIAGYAQMEQGEDALKCFELMQSEAICPDTVTFICVLKACGIVGAFEKGEHIHSEIMRQGLLGKDIVLGTALVDMYVKCGALRKAACVLDELPVRNLVTWNVLLSGYALLGQGEGALECFEYMQCECYSINNVTLGCVLNACSRSGLLCAGQTYFDNMNMKYGMFPNIEHHGCMIDLFSRLGEFDKALSVIKKLPLSGNLPIWRGLLGACRESGNLNLAILAFDNAVQIDVNDASAFMLMSNIYITALMQECL